MPPTHQSGLPYTLLRLPLPRPPVFWASMSPSQHASPFDSAVGDCVQPAAESQHVQSHKNELRVSGALRACPCRQSPVGSSLHVTWAAAPTPSRLLALHIALIVCPPLDSAVCVGVQPAAESRHVQRHKHRLHVSGAAPRMPLPSLTSRVFLARYLGCRTYALPSPGPPCRPHGMPPFGLGRTRRRSTSR